MQLFGGFKHFGLLGTSEKYNYLDPTAEVLWIRSSIANIVSIREIYFLHRSAHKNYGYCIFGMFWINVQFVISVPIERLKLHAKNLQTSTSKGAADTKFNYWQISFVVTYARFEKWSTHVKRINYETDKTSYFVIEKTLPELMFI